MCIPVSSGTTANLHTSLNLYFLFIGNMIVFKECASRHFTEVEFIWLIAT